MSTSILQRVASGDPASMQECIDTYGGLVWSLARRFSVSAADAEDATQEVFIALWEHAGRFDPSLGSEATFISMIARRRLIDRGRKRERRDNLLDKVRAEPAPVSGSPSDAPAQSDEVKRALGAFETLSPSQQQVLTLAIHYGMTHEQIAGHTGLPLGTVKTHARRGLIRIREELASESTTRSSKS